MNTYEMRLLLIEALATLDSEITEREGFAEPHSVKALNSTEGQKFIVRMSDNTGFEISVKEIESKKENCIIWHKANEHFLWNWEGEILMHDNSGSTPETADHEILKPMFGNSPYTMDSSSWAQVHFFNGQVTSAHIELIVEAHKYLGLEQPKFSTSEYVFSIHKSKVK